MKTPVQRILRAALLLLAAVAGGAGAQEPTGVVEGTVFDSTTMSPLQGARVALVGTTSMTQSDAEGRVRLDGVPLGNHPVTFYHNRLQELGISASGASVTVDAGGLARVALAVPSSTTILRAWCAAESPRPDYSPMAGFVRDSLTGVVLPRANVTLAVLDASGRIESSVTGRADDEGYYRLCNVPSDRTVRVVATFGTSGSAPTVLETPSRSASFEDLELTLASIGEIRGQVRDYATREPLSGARVSVLGTDSEILTDAEGEFVLDGLPPGLHLIETEYLGYATRTDSVTIRSDEAVLVEVPLAANAIEIAGMTVTARGRRGDPLTDLGRRTDFIGRPEVDAMLPRSQNVAQLIQGANFPGLSVRDVQVR
ncbi:MAG: carboxypeptidase regulatory-like domain-containing protein, partial [Gemmatimonadota bacterium]